MAQLNSLIVTGSSKFINDATTSAKLITQGPLLVNGINGAGSYDEGIRINAGANNYSSLVIGGAANSTSGTGDYQFWIGTNRANSSYQRKLIIAHNGSTASQTYFYANATGTVSPYLNLGSSGTVTSGNTQAVTGGVVYTALTNGTVTKVGTATVGGTTTPIYLNAGTPTALSYTIAKSVPSNAVFTDTTYTVATGDANGQIKVTPAGETAYNVDVKGLGSAAYTASTAYAAATHSHTISQVTWPGNQNLSASATANSQEWSIDLTPGSYTGTYFHVWSSKNSKSILCCYTDDNSVTVPNGTLTVSKKTTTVMFNDYKTGTGTTAQDKGSGVSPRYFPAKWTFNFGQNPSDGDVIYVKLPCAGHDYGCFISTDNGTTFKPVGVAPSGTSKLTTHYGSGAYLSFVYDATGTINSVYPAAGGDAKVNVSGGCWRVVNFYDTGNTYDRNRYNVAIKAWGTKIVAGNIIVGTGGLFHHLKEGTAFDITYPILYLNADTNASSTTTNTYDCIPFTVTTTQSLTLTAYKPVFIKGRLDGTTFTPYQAACLTQTVPTSDDGYWYIYLGMAYSSTTIYLEHRHPIYAFVGGKFQEASITSGIRIRGLTSATMTYASTTPQISFLDDGGSQGVKILYTDYDSYRAPYGLKVIGDNSAGAAWFEVEGSIFCNGGKYNSYFTATPTSGQVVVTDGTAGGVKTTGYTIAKSVPSDADFKDTKNTAGSTDTSSKIFLIGATSQAANPQTYSDNEVYATSGVLTTKSVQVGGTSATMQYNATNHAIEFIVA